MTSFTHITQTSGRALATALLAGGLVAGTATANPASAGSNGWGWNFNWAPALAFGALASGLNSRNNRADERAAYNRGFLAGRNTFYARPYVAYNIQPYPPNTVWYQQPMQLQGWQPGYSNGWRLNAQVPYNQGQYQPPPSTGQESWRFQPPPRVVHTPRLSDWQNDPLDPGRILGGTAEGDQPDQPSQAADSNAAGTAGAADEDNYQITPRLRF